MKQENITVIAVAATVIVGILGLVILASSRAGTITTFEKEMVDIADNVGINTDEFIVDYKSQEVRDEADFSYQAALARNVKSTPTIIINEESIFPVDQYSEWKTILQTRLDAREDQTEKLVIDLYEDFQCSLCAQFAPLVQQAEKEFANEITVNTNYFFLNPDNTKSTRYAYGAIAAERQGKGHEFAREVFIKEFPNVKSIFDAADLAEQQRQSAGIDPTTSE
jgi:predicted DsbA family dithiol-disulfide isomerase